MSYHSLWIAIVLAAHVAAIGRVLLNSEMSPEACMSWLIVIVFLPVVGIGCYLFSGERWMARRFRRQARHVSAMRRQFRPDPSGPAIVPDRYRPVFASCEHIGGYRAAGGSHAALAADSDSAVAAMVADFDEVRETIHVSFYIWLTDLRNHRKIVVVDNRITHCGSQNCADQAADVRSRSKARMAFDNLLGIIGPVY